MILWSYYFYVEGLHDPHQNGSSLEKKFISEKNVVQGNETNLIFEDSFYMYFDALLWIKILPVHKYNDINYFNYFPMSKDLLGKTPNDID